LCCEVQEGAVSPIIEKRGFEGGTWAHCRVVRVEKRVMSPILDVEQLASSIEEAKAF
jgi:hypothetical protein